MKRGFKSQSEKRAIEVRRTFGLADIDPLQAQDVAHKLGVRVWSPSDIAGLSAEDLAHLVHGDPDGWSAFTLRIDRKFLVVYNPAQTPPRVNSVVMHELAHIMLGHELAEAGVTDDGHLIPSHYNQEQEDEADWLGSTLLLPRPALLWIRSQRMTNDRASLHFNVSGQMLQWRFRMTGVDAQLYRSRY